MRYAKIIVLPLAATIGWILIASSSNEGLRYLGYLIGMCVGGYMMTMEDD